MTNSGKYEWGRDSKFFPKRGHRIAVQKMLGRDLSEDEVIHHKNGNKGDNQLANLEIMTRSEHTTRHSKGRTHTGYNRTKICAYNEHGELVRQYDSIYAATKDGFSRECIRKCLNGMTKKGKHKHLIWKVAPGEVRKDLWKAKSIIAVDPATGSIVGEYKGAMEASRMHNCEPIAIEACCKGRQLREANLIWLYKSDEIKIKDRIKRCKEHDYWNNTKILCINKTNGVSTTFSNLKEAVKAVEKAHYTTVQAQLRHGSAIHAGYIWYTIGV